LVQGQELLGLHEGVFEYPDGKFKEGLGPEDCSAAADRSVMAQRGDDILLSFSSFKSTEI
jgi:hypothetical protein